MGEAKRKAGKPAKIELMKISGQYCLGFHNDDHMRPGRITDHPESKIVTFVDIDGVRSTGPERYSVIFDELQCSDPECNATHGPAFPETKVSVPMVEMGAWYFFDTREQCLAFWQALQDREAGRPYDNTLTANWFNKERRS